MQHAPLGGLQLRCQGPADDDELGATSMTMNQLSERLPSHRNRPPAKATMQYATQRAQRTNTMRRQTSDLSYRSVAGFGLRLPLPRTDDFGPPFGLASSCVTRTRAHPRRALPPLGTLCWFDHTAFRMDLDGVRRTAYECADWHELDVGAHIQKKADL